MPVRLTATEAGILASKQRQARPEIVEALLDCYMGAIDTTARQGRRVLAHSNVPIIRTPVYEEDRQAVYAKLRDLGYTVHTAGVEW